MAERPDERGPDKSISALSQWPFFPADNPVEYWMNACQRSILFLDVLRRRGGLADIVESGRVVTLFVCGLASGMTVNAGPHVVA